MRYNYIDEWHLLLIKMRLERLEIIGFKSFKERTVLEFPDRFTVIVGPNGSGKSNIVESICFVLGRSRGLRANTLTDLIYNGGTRGEKLSYAKVTMHLSNNGNRFKISRTIDRDGNSIYKLDGKRTSRQKIIELLGDNEYNIILQDDITRIIDMKPRERREIIDDLCGIREYDKKKEKALKELEEVEKRISEAHIILGERRGYLKRLKTERDDALRYKELQEDLKRHKASILRKLINSERKRLEGIENEIRAINDRRDDMVDKLKKLKIRIGEKNDKLKLINSEIMRLEEKRIIVRIPEVRGELNRINDRFDILHKNLKDVEDEISKIRKRRESLEEEKSGIEKELIIINDKLSSIDEKIKNMNVVKEEGIEDNIESLRSRISDIRSEISIRLDLEKRNNDEIARLRTEEQVLNEKIRDLKKRVRELDREMEKRRKTHETELIEFNRLKSELERAERRGKELLEILNSLRVEFARRNTELKVVKKTTDATIIKSIMKLRRIIPGIYGVVSQLGDIKGEKYKNALMVAAGAMANYIVVENEDVAAKCIKYLRKKKIGRCTFLPLNRINIKLREDLPRNAMGFARDFIRCEKKFRRVFDYVFGNTIIVRDIDSAKPLIGEWRIVTLDGDIIERGGAISGGYTRRFEVKFSRIDELEKEIRNLEKRIIEADGQAQEIAINRRKIENKILELQEVISNFMTEMERMEVEKNSSIERLKDAEHRISEIRDVMKKLRDETTANRKELKKFERELGRLEGELKRLVDERSKMNLDLLDRLKDEHRDLEIKKRCLEERKLLIERQINEFERNLKGLINQKKTLLNEIKSIEDERSRLENNLRELDEESKGLEEKIEKLMRERDILENEISNLGSESGKIRHEIDALDENVNKLMINKARIETKLNSLEEEFREFENIEVIDMGINKLRENLSKIELELESIGSVNLKAIDNYERLSLEIRDIEKKIDTLKEERQSIFDFMERVEMRKRETFMRTFNTVRDNFERIYRELSGGNGTLILDNPNDISESGLLISASPRGKKLMSIDMMSMGEKVVTSSAFLLAIQQYKPSYFYILDEIDASLDDKNSERLAKMFKKSEGQFILITHNDYIMKNADSLIGVKMNDGVSEIYGVKLT